jgi:hypothetical protein
MMTAPDLRERIGWMLWCLDQGYVKAEDIAILNNWLLEDEATLTAEDRALKVSLLEMADLVIAAVRHG